MQTLSEIYRKARNDFLVKRLPNEDQWATEKDLSDADDFAAQVIADEAVERYKQYLEENPQPKRELI